MASEKSLNVENLATLGAGRLAELLLELTGGDAGAKRRLRLELASLGGSAAVAAQVGKRLRAIASSKSLNDWRKARLLAQDLDAQRVAIMAHVAPADPVEAFDLLWQLLQMAPTIYERCDDSAGAVSAVMEQALADLSAAAVSAKLAPQMLADRVFAAVCDNAFGQFDGLIPKLAEALGEEGLAVLKLRFEELARTLPSQLAIHDDQSRDTPKWEGNMPWPAFERLLDDHDRKAQARMVRTALTQIFDALGDADGYAARFSADDHANPAVAASIAGRLLAAGRAEDAIAALTAAEAAASAGGHWPDWHRISIEALDQVGRLNEAQSERWAIFERNLDKDCLRDFLKRLPDFETMKPKLEPWPMFVSTQASMRRWRSSSAGPPTAWPPTSSLRVIVRSTAATMNYWPPRPMLLSSAIPWPPPCCFAP
jgi:hypothetical protein